MSAQKDDTCILKEVDKMSIVQCPFATAAPVRSAGHPSPCLLRILLPPILRPYMFCHYALFNTFLVLHQVTVEATLEHPFFVFGQGWSSCNPQQTLHRYGLQCHRLTVGDVCISLTHKDASTPSSSGAPSPKDPHKDKQGAATPKRKQPSPKPGAPSRPARASSTGAIHPNSEPGLLPRHCSPAGGHSALPPTASSSASSPSFPTSSTPPRRRWSAPDQLPACKRDVESKCRASPNNKMTTMSPPVSVNVVVSKSSSSSRPVG